MKTFAVFAVLLVAASAADVPKDLIKGVMKEKFFESCFGEQTMKDWTKKMTNAITKCLKATPIYTEEQLFGDLSNARVNPVAINDVDNDKIEKFVGIFDDLKMEKTMKMSNLSCVMKDLKLWKEDNSVDIDSIKAIKEKIEDIELRDGLMEAIDLCNDLAKALPEPANLPKIKKMFGKQIVFTKCLEKKEMKLCTMKSIADSFEDEERKPFNAQEAILMGLPPKRLQASIMRLKVLEHSFNPVQKFLFDYIIHGKDM